MSGSNNTDQPEQHVSNKEEVLTDPKLSNQQRSRRLDQEEPEPLQIKQEPEPPAIKEDREKPEPTHNRENQLEPGHLLIKEDQEEPEFRKSVVRYQDEIRLLDICWNPQIKLTRISADILKQHVCKEEEVLNEQQEPEAPEFEDGQENIKQDQEEPQKIKEDPEKPEPQQFKEKLENSEGLTIKEDQEDLDLPQIKDEPEGSPFEEEPEGPQIEDLKAAEIVVNQREPEPTPFEEEPEGPQIEDLKAAEIVVNQEEPEPPPFDSGHEEQHLLIFLIHSGQQIEQLLSVCETNTFMDPLTHHQRVFGQSEPDTEQLHTQNPPEDQKSFTELHSFYSRVMPDPELITEEHYGSEPPPVQQGQKEICSSLEEEQLMDRPSQDQKWFKAQPDTEQLHSQNPPEDQKSFIELKSVYSCLMPDPEQIKDQQEPPHIQQQQQEIYRSWEEEYLMGRTSWEHVGFKAQPDTELLHYHNSPEDLHSFCSAVTPDPGQITAEHYGSEPVQQEQKTLFSSWEEEDVEATTSQVHGWFIAEPDAVETQNQEGTGSAVSDQSPLSTQNSKICFVCGVVLKPHRLNQHLKQHPGVKPYVCKRCGESFSEGPRLRDHMVSHLAADLEARQRPGVKLRQKNFFCKICRRGFAELAYLKSHNKQVHEWDRPFCGTCGKHFSTPSSLKGHMKIHERRCAKPFSCWMCKKRFASRSTKKAHMERHKEEKPFSCKTCGETFNNRKQLITHRGTHSAAKICKQRFAHRPSYTAHMKSHRKETTSSCSRCGESFNDKRAVAKHMKTCGKLYSCDTCGKSFSSRSRVKYHEKGGSCGGKVGSKP